MAVLLLLGGLLAWRSYTTSPGYSLGQLAVAVERNDWDGVQKYVDLDSLIGQIIDVAVSKTIETDTSGFGALAAGLAQSMKPTLIQQAKDSWRKSVESGSSSSGGTSGNFRPVFAAKRVKSVTRIGDEALVTVEVPSSGTTYDVRLRMKRVDNFWRVTSIENLSDLPFMQDLGKGQ